MRRDWRESGTWKFVNRLSQSSGDTVFVLVRNKRTADRLLELGRRNVLVLEADITDVKALKTAAQEVAKVNGGTLDVLISNAAFVDNERNGLTLDGYPEGREDLLQQDLLKHFTVNIIGVTHTTNAFLPLIRSSSHSDAPSAPSREDRKGNLKKVVTISSGDGDIPFTLSTGNTIAAPYSISKAAVNLAVAKYAAKYKNEGIVFLSIGPGVLLCQPTGKDLKKLGAILASFRKAYPNFAGPIPPEESVKVIFNVVDRATIKDTGSRMRKVNGGCKLSTL